MQAQLKATALGAYVEEFRFCGAASRVDEWIILAYQVISDQRVNVFTIMLPARVIIVSLSTANYVNGSSLSADSGNKNFTCDCKERLHLKVNTVIGHEMMHVPPKLSYTNKTNDLILNFDSRKRDTEF